MRELKVVRSGEISAGGGWEMYAESGMGVGKKSCAEVLRGLRENAGTRRREKSNACVSMRNLPHCLVCGDSRGG